MEGVKERMLGPKFNVNSPQHLVKLSLTSYRSTSTKQPYSTTR
jgi:hypothetical protein